MTDNYFIAEVNRITNNYFNEWVDFQFAKECKLPAGGPIYEIILHDIIRKQNFINSIFGNFKYTKNDLMFSEFVQHYIITKVDILFLKGGINLECKIKGYHYNFLGLRRENYSIKCDDTISIKRTRDKNESHKEFIQDYFLQCLHATNSFIHRRSK